MPVYLDREPGLPAGEAFRFGLTREGWLEPWLRLRNSEPGEQSRLGMLPAVRVLNGARDLKPGASLLGVVTDSAGRAYPALAAQRLGLGRVATLLVGDLWRSGLRDQAAQADLQKWWRQWLRWLVAEVPRRVELHCVPKPEEGAAMRLQTRVRDAEYRPLDNATVSVSIRHLTNAVTGTAVGDAVATAPEVLRLTAEPSPEEPGLYETTYVPREDGAYVAQATAIDADGVGVGRAEAGWTAELSAEEFRSLGVNRGLMTSLAQATGGRVLRPGELDGFVRELPRRSAPIRELVSEPIWHRAGVFLFALACFISEWGLRRSKGMA